MKNLKYNLTISDLHSIPVLYNLYKIPSHPLSIPQVNMNVCCDCLTVWLWTNLLSKKKEWLKMKQKMKCINMSLLFSSIGKGFVIKYNLYKLFSFSCFFAVFLPWLVLLLRQKKEITLQMSTFYGYSFFSFFFFCFAR